MNILKNMRFILLTVLLTTLTVIPVHSSGLESLTYYTESYPPFNFVDQGAVTGISIDLLQEAATLAGQEVLLSQIVLQPWARSYRFAILKKDAVLFSTTRTEHREDLFHWVGPIDDIKVTIIARKGSNITLEEPLEITSYKIGVIRDDVGEQLLLQHGVPRESMQESTNVTMLAELLIKKRIDLIAYDERSAHWWIKQAGYKTDQFETVYVLKQGLLYYAFNKNVDQALLDDLQKGIDKVKNTNNDDGVNRYQAILNKYR
ncbi:substrate-binding periplasmic protein [Vibrio aestuarianus]